MSVGEEIFYLEPHRLGVSFLSGILLSFSGSLIQMLTHNPLASSSTLGFDAYFILLTIISLLGVYTPGSFLQGYSVEYCSLMALLVTVIVILGILFKNKNKKRKTPYGNSLNHQFTPILLIGLSFNLLAAALFSLVQFFFMALQKEFPSDFWFGHFRFVMPWMFPFLLVSTSLLWIVGLILSSRLQVLEYGMDFAVGLGMKVKHDRTAAYLLSFICNGLVMLLFGPLTFLGLMFPHLIRTIPWIRVSLYREVFFGAILSGILLMVLDTLCFLFPFYGTEIPVGLVTSVLGPLFMMIMMFFSFRQHTFGGTL
jgi:iron complex transport system permease protein